jgi:hypothetical protein
LAFRYPGLFRGEARDFQLAAAELAQWGARLERQALLPRDELRTAANRSMAQGAGPAPLTGRFGPADEEAHLPAV